MVPSRTAGSLMKHRSSFGGFHLPVLAVEGSTSISLSGFASGLDDFVTQRHCNYGFTLIIAGLNHCINCQTATERLGKSLSLKSEQIAKSAKSLLKFKAAWLH